MYYTLQILTWFPIVFLVLYLVLNYIVKGNKSACVVVLGDVGRSPRMQYHAVSLAREGLCVDLVGYGGSMPHTEVNESENINVHFMREAPQFFRVLPRLLSYFVKVIWQAVTLGFTLLILPKSRYILLQNPPAIPTIAVCWFVSLVRFSHLVIDWHNYGFTILGLSVGDKHPFVIFSKWYEKFFGRLAKSAVCVTKAMKEDLKNNWKIEALTLYDRAPARFQITPIAARHDLFMRLSSEYPIFKGESAVDTVFTLKNNKDVVNKQKRPVLLISSTSWTEDEDFSVLLNALEDYEAAALKTGSKLPDIICVITGKGPQKEMYKEKMSELRFAHVKFCLPWLESDDYPLLLGSADIGVCLHKSSSGLDLPMKVVDMFGCGLPVCAIHFDCLSELVKHGENGLVFKDSLELSQQLQRLLNGFPDSISELEKMRENVKSFQAVRWHDQWKQIALPLFREKMKTD